MTIRLELPKVTELKPRITVIGVGGAGGNAVNNMIASGLTGVEFIVANTDAQALAASSAELRIQLGANLTEGLGAGSKPEIGQAAAEEAVDDIRSQISGSHMVFIAAGMGGGTGTGAAAVIARIAKELDILVVAIVTKPFQFEGARRMRMAETGIAELKRTVDTMIVIPNQNLFRVATERTTFAEAFVLADQVLYSGIACIVDLIVKEGLINLDFADVRTVLQGMGSAVMGTGEASGERRAVMAAEEAICNPLLDDVSLKGARGLLLSIIGGKNLTLYEVDEAASRVRMEVDPEANIIVGATFDESLQDRVRVSIVASGMDHQMSGHAPRDNGQRDVGHQNVGHQNIGHQDAALAAAAPHWAPQAPQAPSQPKQQPYYHHTAPAPSQTGPAVEPNGAIAPQIGPLRNLPEPRPQPSHPISPPLRAPSQREADDYARAMTDAYSQQQPLQNSSPQQGPHGQRHDAMTARNAWESPNGVTIEEALAPLAAPVVPPPLPHAPRPEQNAVEPGFTPQAPIDVRRPTRRMPELTDFPEIAQRDYRAKAPAPQSGDRGPAAPAKTPAADTATRRKQGLFERLSSFGRRESDDDNLYTSYPQTRQDAGEPRREPTAQSTKVSPAHPGERSPQRGHQNADFPGFFDKKAR